MNMLFGRCKTLKCTCYVFAFRGIEDVYEFGTLQLQPLKSGYLNYIRTVPSFCSQGVRDRGVPLYTSHIVVPLLRDHPRDHWVVSDKEEVNMLAWNILHL